MEETIIKDIPKKKPFSYGNLTLAVGVAMGCTSMAILLLLLFPYFESHYDFDAPRGNPGHWVQTKDIPLEWMSPAEVASSLQTISFEFNRALTWTGLKPFFWLLIWGMVGVYFLSALVSFLVRNHWSYPIEATEKILIGFSLALPPVLASNSPSGYLPLLSLVVILGALAWRRILLFPLLIGLITWEVASSAGISMESYLGDYRPVFENPLVSILLGYLIFFSLLSVGKMAALNFWPSKEEKDQRGPGPFLVRVLDDLKDSGGNWITLGFFVLIPVLVFQWLSLEYPIGRWDFIFAFPWTTPAELAYLFENWTTYIQGFIGRRGYQFGMIYLAHCIGFLFLFRILADYLRKPLWGKGIDLLENFLALLLFLGLPGLLPLLGCDPSHLPVLYLVACIALIFRPLLIGGTFLFFFGWCASLLGFGNLPGLYNHWKVVVETDLFWVPFNFALGFTLLLLGDMALSKLWDWYGRNLGRTLVEDAGRMARGRNYEEALKNLDRSMICYPGYVEAFKLRGEICEFQRDYAGALTFFQQALEAVRKEKLRELIGSLEAKVEEIQKKIESLPISPERRSAENPSGFQGQRPATEEIKLEKRESSSSQKSPKGGLFLTPPSSNLTVHKTSREAVIVRISHSIENLKTEITGRFSQGTPKGKGKSSGWGCVGIFIAFFVLINFW